VDLIVVVGVDVTSPRRSNVDLDLDPNLDVNGDVDVDSIVDVVP
jgi:hypothetical protein